MFSLQPICSPLQSNQSSILNVHRQLAEMRLLGSIVTLLAIAELHAQKYFYNPDKISYDDSVDACRLKQMVLAEPKSDALWMEQITYIDNNVPMYVSKFESVWLQYIRAILRTY